VTTWLQQLELPLQTEQQQKNHITKTQASYVMQHGIAWQEKMVLQQIVQSKMFLLLVGESADIAVPQILARAVRYFDEHAPKTVDSLLNVVEVDDTSEQGL